MAKTYFVKNIFVISLIPRPEEAEEEKGPGFSHFVHALNHGGIPPLPHIIDTRSTNNNTAVLFSRTSDAEDPDHCLLYALQQLDSPELRPKPEQWFTIESVYRGKDVFGWYLQEIINSLLDASSRYTTLSVNLCCIPVVLNNATLFLLLTSVWSQAFITDIVILAHKYTCCLSSE